MLWGYYGHSFMVSVMDEVQLQPTSLHSYKDTTLVGCGSQIELFLCVSVCIVYVLSLVSCRTNSKQLKQSFSMKRGLSRQPFVFISKCLSIR